MGKNYSELSEEERIKLAMDGKPEDLDVLVHDESERVRYKVAEHGRKQDIKILMDDDSAKVLAVVIRVADEEDLDILGTKLTSEKIKEIDDYVYEYRRMY